MNSLIFQHVRCLVPAQNALVVAAIVVLLLLSLPQIHSGFGVLSDSEAIYEVHADILKGHIIPSRSVGFPLYEIPVARIINFFGVAGANLYSLFLILAFLGSMAVLLRERRNGALLFPALALHPLVVGNATVLMETPQSVLLVALTTLCAVYYERRPSVFWLAGMTACNTCALLTRVDNVFFTAALTCALVLNAYQGWRARLAIVMAMFFSGALFLFVYRYLYYDFGLLLGAPVMQYDNPIRKIVRAALGYVALLGIPATCCLGLLVLRQWRAILSGLGNLLRLSFVSRFFAFMLLFFSIRFAMLPDKIDYIIPLYMAFVLFVSDWTISRKIIVALVVCILFQQALSFSLFDRDGSGKLHVRPAVNPGAYMQNVQVRAIKQLQGTAEFLTYYRAQVKMIIEEFGENPEDSCAYEPLEMMAKTCSTVVIPSSVLYRLTEHRFPTFPRIEQFRHVVVLQTNIIPFFIQKSRVTGKPTPVCDGWEAWQQLKRYHGYDELRRAFQTNDRLRYKVLEGGRERASS